MSSNPNRSSMPTLPENCRWLNNLLDSGELERLAAPSTDFHEISYSRVGGFGDSQLADELIDRLAQRGLAKRRKNQMSVPMHPLVRQLVLALLSQLLRNTGPKGISLQPATDNPQLLRAFSEVLSLPNLPSAGNVVASDLQTVSVDVSDIPLNEVLGFRTEHEAEFSAYTRNVRKFV
jgi:hypothetical protein